MSEVETHLTRNVFVAGGIPDVTYNPRGERKIEDEVRAYLAQDGKALSISGPTKSGKTVLVQRMLPSDSAIWMQGSDIRDIDAFWDRIVDWMGLYDQVQVSTGSGTGTSGSASASAGFPGIAQLSGSTDASRSSTSSSTWSRQRQLADVARDGLATLAVPIVIDDFHYVL